ncbi:MAG: hypothetical protein WCZ18_07380 [Ottowia sp.]|nr:hypothetical protein [Ottowia sp.]
MFMPTRRRWLLASVSTAAALLAGACASGGSVIGAGSGEDALLERARAYWDAIKDNDRLAAWPLDELSLDPRWTLQDYVKRGGIIYHEAEVLGVHEIDGDQAQVDVRIRFDVPQARMRNQKGVIHDHWRLVDGLWYHEHRRGAAPGTRSGGS